MKLCVVIPTFNRKEKLERTLVYLKNQIRDDFYIVIADNNSDYRIEDIVASFSDEFKKRIIIKKNKFNIGMCGNIAGLFEKADAEWCWFLSDDDFPQKTAIDTIMNDIDIYSKQGVSIIQYPHFKIADEMIKEYTIVGNLVDYIEYFNNLLTSGNTLTEVEGTLVYLSNKVYRIGMLGDYIRYAYDYCNTGIPQVMPIIKALDDCRAHILLHNEIIIHTDPENERSWNIKSIALGMSTIRNIPLNLDEKRKKELWYLLMIRFKLVLEDYFRNGVNDFDYLNILYNNIYKYILNPNHNDYYSEVLRHAKEGTEMKYLKMTIGEAL